MKKEEIFNKHSFQSIGAISPSKDFCLDAMEEYALQEQIALLAELFGYGTTDKEMLKYIKDRMKELSSEYKKI